MFSELTFLAEWWSGLDIKLYGTKEDFDKLGKESAICLCNHRSDVDWLIGYTVADRAGVLAVCELNWRLASSDQASVVQRADNFIQWISYCLADKMYSNPSFWQVFHTIPYSNKTDASILYANFRVIGKFLRTFYLPQSDISSG